MRRRFPPTFMPGTPWSQPAMTWAGPDPERERLSAVVRAVELRAFVQRADVVDGDGVAHGGRRTGADDQVLDDQRAATGGRRGAVAPAATRGQGQENESGKPTVQAMSSSVKPLSYRR